MMGDDREHPLLKSLAGLMDNPLTTEEQRRFTYKRICENDLAALREALLTAEPNMPEELRQELAGPLPTDADIAAWRSGWGHKYQYLQEEPCPTRRKPWWQFW